MYPKAQRGTGRPAPSSTLERPFVEIETWHSRRNVSVVDCFSYGFKIRLFWRLAYVLGLPLSLTLAFR